MLGWVPCDAIQFLWDTFVVNLARVQGRRVITSFLPIAVNSTGSSASSATKYDPDLLKSDVSHARARVLRLKRELANIDSEMAYKQKGVETLAQ